MDFFNLDNEELFQIASEIEFSQINDLDEIILSRFKYWW
jgi:hypothetical protein